MDTELIKQFMKIVRKHSPSCFINTDLELIIVPKNNIYFKVEDIETELDLKVKILTWLSRPATKGISEYYQLRIRNIICEYFEEYFSYEDLEKIYTYLGNDVDRDNCIRFIESDFDFKLLAEKGADS